MSEDDDAVVARRTQALAQGVHLRDPQLHGAIASHLVRGGLGARPAAARVPLLGVKGPTGHGPTAG